VVGEASQPILHPPLGRRRRGGGQGPRAAGRGTGWVPVVECWLDRGRGSLGHEIERSNRYDVSCAQYVIWWEGKTGNKKLDENVFLVD
jgi:hypothetical protein